LLTKVFHLEETLTNKWPELLFLKAIIMHGCLNNHLPKMIWTKAFIVIRLEVLKRKETVSKLNQILSRWTNGLKVAVIGNLNQTNLNINNSVMNPRMNKEILLSLWELKSLIVQMRYPISKPRSYLKWQKVNTKTNFQTSKPYMICSN